MADFCQTCATKTLGFDKSDLAGITTRDDTAAGRYATVRCEGCGPILVDHNGRRAKPPARLRVPRVLNKRTDRIPPDAIYCGRPSPLGNPFIIGRDGTRDEVCDKYEAWLPSQPEIDGDDPVSRRPRPRLLVRTRTLPLQLPAAAGQSGSVRPRLTSGGRCRSAPAAVLEKQSTHAGAHSVTQPLVGRPDIAAIARNPVRRNRALRLRQRHLPGAHEPV